MKSKLIIVLLMIISLSSCNRSNPSSDMRIIFLHHSTGNCIWNGDQSKPGFLLGKIFRKISGKPNRHALIPSLLKRYNKDHGSNYFIDERSFPSDQPYGWHNYPFDYYNIWVKNAGHSSFLEEPTLEILSQDYQVIIFKHCFPVSSIQPDQDTVDINSDYKSLDNYKLQYMALRDKLHQFNDTKFIIWTGAALVKSQTNEEEAKRSRDFFTWVKNEWDLPNDNIFIWDFYELQTEGQLYFQDKYARSPEDSHPGYAFSDRAGRLFFNRLMDVITSNGSTTSLTGELR